MCVCQVWAVGEDRGLYFRMGVTLSEPSGNGWIPISTQWGPRKDPGPRSVGEFSFFYEPGWLESLVSLWNRSECAGHVTQATPPPLLSYSDSDSEVGPTGMQPIRNETPVLEAASPSVVPLAGPDVSPPTAGSDLPSDAPKPFIPTSDSFINSLVSDRDKASTPQASILEEAEELSPAPVLATPDPEGHNIPWMNVDLEGAEASRSGQEARASPAEGAASYTLGTLETSQAVGETDGPVWAWISGGGCEVDAESQTSWLSPTGTFRSSIG